MSILDFFKKKTPIAKNQTIGPAFSITDGADPDSVKVFPGENKKEIIVSYQERGSTGTRIYGGYIREDFLDTMNGIQRAEEFEKMRRSDYQTKMLLSSIKNVIKAAKWVVNPGIVSEGDSATEEAQNDADFIEYILFEDMDDEWDKTVSEILTLIDFGFSLFEIVHKVVIGDSKWGSYNGIRKMGWRSPRTIFQWNVDRDTESLVSVTQIAFGDAGRLVDIPSQFLVNFNVEQEGANFEGISFLRCCYGPWQRKNNALKLNAAGMEKYAIPTPTAEIPDSKLNSDQYNHLISSLEAYTSHQSNYVTYPAGWKIDLKPNSGYDPSKMDISVNYEDQRMTKSFLAQFLELGMGHSSSSSRSQSSNLSDYFLSQIEYLTNGICARINKRIIRPLILMNRGPRDAYPQIVCTGISDKGGQEFANIVKTLVDARIVVPDNPLEDMMRERYGLSIRSDDGQRQANNPGIPGQPQDGQENTDNQESDSTAPKSFKERISFARWRGWEGRQFRKT